MQRFELLVEALRRAAPQSRPLDADPDRYAYLPFFEAYFSNFIEGTEFEVDEAARIVFDKEIPASRPEDAHDIIGTYRLVADPEEMVHTGHNADEFVALVKRRNATIMDGRPHKRPGAFKDVVNRVGGTYFVEPELVEGTLRAGYRLRNDLDTAWEKALLVAFVVAEVHPFDDGNGRTARVMMNAELQAASRSRIIIPTVFRQDYLDGLRMLSRRNDASVFIKAMRYAHDFTASVDYTDYAKAKRQLTEANAFEDPDSANQLKILGRAPVPSPTTPWRTG
ncbi:Fic family protein [Phytoactinopolyspora limicola]|uniref:Fic family protein n=1 Tax=Phytoactinopolyspora limicola TaxID=2715536 RepID=UPI001408CF9F|nr:Fic family protein [Phytoactinopolyspora limicola]